MQRPFAPLLGHRFATRCRSGDTHGHCPARALAGGVALPAAHSLRAIALRRISPLLRPHPTTAFAFANCSPPKFPCRTFETRSAFGYPQMNTFSADMPPLPRRAHLAQIESARRCWFHEHRSADHAKTFNETLRKRFTCVIAYPFVRRDSRTSVALCTPRLPNCTSTSLQ